jgi:hypothetical protein
MVAFKKATKKQAYLRLGGYGPSGSGKTFGMLRVAVGLAGPGERIALIDSERGSAAKYSDRFDFDVCELGENRSIDAYLEAIKGAARAGYGVLIIDSLTHAWQELLEEVERIAKARYKGNTWSAWSEATPMQRSLIDAIMTYPGHVLVTMRAKTEWGTEKNNNGKNTPTRVGLAPEQRQGVEYELDMLISITTEHYASVEKDRSGKFQDKTLDRLDEDFGRALAAWLRDGEPAQSPATTSPGVWSMTELQKRALMQAIRDLGIESGSGTYVADINGGERVATNDQYEAVMAELNRRVEAQKAADAAQKAV